MIATGQNKEIEMIHERRYNAVHIKDCSGGLDSNVNDCRCRKPSRGSWYKEKGQVTTYKLDVHPMLSIQNLVLTMVKK